MEQFLFFLFVCYLLYWLISINHYLKNISQKLDDLTENVEHERNENTPDE